MTVVLPPSESRWLRCERESTRTAVADTEVDNHLAVRQTKHCGPRHMGRDARKWFMFVFLPPASHVWFTCNSFCVFTLSCPSDPIPSSIQLDKIIYQVCLIDNVARSPFTPSIFIPGQPASPLRWLATMVQGQTCPWPIYCTHQLVSFFHLESQQGTDCLGLQMRKASPCCARRRGGGISIVSSIGYAKGSCRPPAVRKSTMPCQNQTAGKMKADRGSRTQGMETRIRPSHVLLLVHPVN